MASSNTIESKLDTSGPKFQANAADMRTLLAEITTQQAGTTAFMAGKDAKWSGIIRAGAKMVSAVSTSVVPKITVILGGSFGAGHYAMCGKAYDPRFIFAWPTARYAVMGGAAAANTRAEVKARQLEKSGQIVSDETKRALWQEIKAGYDAARLWVDAIIDPAKTREVLMLALEACALNPDVAKFNVGVLQT